MTSLLGHSAPSVATSLGRTDAWLRSPRPSTLDRPALGRGLADALAVAAASCALVWASGTTGTPVAPLAWIVVFDLITIVAMGRRGLRTFRLRSSLWDDLGATLACTVIAAAATVTMHALMAPDANVARRMVPVWGCVTATLWVLRTGSALGDRRAWRHGQAEPTLIIGAGTVGQGMARRLLDHPELGLRPVGFLDKEPMLHDVGDGRPPVLGASWDLEEQVARHNVKKVVFTFSTAPHHVQLDLIRRSHVLGLDVLVIPRLFEQISGEVNLAHVGGLPVLQVRPVKLSSWQFSIKYMLDRIVAGLALAFVSPVMIAVAVGVRLTSPGPVLYRQRRITRDGQEFEMLKFRTMYDTPDVAGGGRAAWAAAILQQETPSTESLADRRTPFGRILRGLSIDELPQLINVLRGEMSLVGPRPETPLFVDGFRSRVHRYGDRHRVKCGITGWAQVHGLRGDTSLIDRVEWDNYYIENWSLWLDLKILLMTFPAALGGRHAD